jgi:large subunit ribosomal protein L5
MAKNDNSKGAKGGKNAGAKGGGKNAGGKGGAKPGGKGAPVRRAAAPPAAARRPRGAARTSAPRWPPEPRRSRAAGAGAASQAVLRADGARRLAQQFGLENPHEIPGLQKIVINCGVGEAIKTPKALDSVVEELALIAGQRPVRRKAKKSIANFGLREGQEIGAMVTLRGSRMWEFLDRLISVSLPRVRDFRGLGTRSFDGRGNYSMGVKEQMIFPEINYDMVEQVHGMDVTFVTTTTKDDQAFALLRELGMPFRGDVKPLVPRPDQMAGQLTETGAAV